MRAPDQRHPALVGADPRLPLGLGPKRTAIACTFLGQLDLGVREEPPRSNDGPEIRKYRPSWAEPGSWCAWFATWCLFTALGFVPTGRRRGAVAAIKADAIEVDLWQPKAGYLPSPGDLFILDTDGDRGNAGHVGFVLGYRAGKIETVEGNSGDRVRHGVRSLDDPRLEGFVCTVPEEPFEACWWTGFGEDLSRAPTR